MNQQAVFKAFLCHASEDKGFVDQLYFELSQRGETVWYDKICINPGDSLYNSIEDGLTRSNYFCIILSRHSVKKPWVQKELKAALVIENKRAVDEFRIIPVLYDIEDQNIPL